MKQVKRIRTFFFQHWLDLGIFCVLGALLVSFFVFFYRKAEYISIKVKVTDQEILSAFRLPNSIYALHFQVGDVERDAVGRVVSEITAVDSFAADPVTQMLELTLRVRATYDARTKLYSARGKTLMYGTPMRFNLGNVTFDGYVTEVQGSYQPAIISKQVKLLTIIRGLHPDILAKISQGDTMIDSQGKQLVKVLKVSTAPAEQVTQNSAGQLLKAYNPLFVDVRMELEVAGKLINQKELYSFVDAPFLTGSSVPLITSKYALYPEIIDVVAN